jgi:hypothetical protein
VLDTFAMRPLRMLVSFHEDGPERELRKTLLSNWPNGHRR